MENKLTQLKECQLMLLGLIAEFISPKYSNSTICALEETLGEIEHSIYINNGWRLCEGCYEYHPEEGWSKLVEGTDNEMCVCVKCEQTVINDLEIEE